MIIGFLNIVQAQKNDTLMVVQLSGNILDCPHFGQKLGEEAAQKFNLKLFDKDYKTAKVVFQISNSHFLDSLRNNFLTYLREINFPMNYFKEIYFSNTYQNESK